MKFIFGVGCTAISAINSFSREAQRYRHGEPPQDRSDIEPILPVRRQPGGCDPVVAVRLPRELLAQVDAWAGEKSVQRSDAIRETVAYAVAGRAPEIRCNATTHIGLDDRGIAEVDLDAERGLDVWKVRSVQQPGQARSPQLRKLEP
jgi:hypothetical protein